MEDHVILVDGDDAELGTSGKMAAHLNGELHRAVSVFVFDGRGRVMLQKRAAAKYHSGGLWSNTCCSHPRPNEQSADAARRRLREEMGFDCELEEVFSFVYRASLGNGLIEHEYDHVFFGSYDGCPELNPDEAEDWTWMEIDQLSADVRERPQAYSFWLGACWHHVLGHVNSNPRYRPSGAQGVIAGGS